jgi:hypothetical protein
MYYHDFHSLPRERWFVLYLNDMRSSNIEIVRPVLKSQSREAIEKLLEESRAPEPWSDEGRWRKVFRKGSRLEWYNPPDLSDGGGFPAYSGIVEQLSIHEAALNYANRYSRELSDIEDL